MGQGGSKPSIRQVLPVAEQDTCNEVTEEETGENIIDMLCVSAEESDYPEPKPPHHDKNERSQTGKMSEPLPNTTSSKGQDGEIFSTKSILEEEYHVDMVPVGASFQNTVKKKTNVSDENGNLPNDNITPWSSYPVVKTMTKSLYVRDSLLGSRPMNSSSMLSGLSQREAMLADREKYEFLQFMTPSTETVTYKGQVKRFNYHAQFRDESSVTTNKFRNVEDRLADEIAEKHRDHRAETYISLVKDLTDRVISDRLKVRIILAWISKQGIGRLQFASKPSPDTPNGYMMLIQDGKGTFPVFFALMCRAAKLKCAIISGISKGSHYEVGSKDTENLKNTWNAVYVEGAWQLVHPLWVCKGVANRQLGGWMKIEEEGKAQRKMSVASIGKDLPSFNPYFIFTKPEEFIYRNFPDEERWQLLPKPFTLDEFLKLTYIRPIFFQNDFKLQSEDSCIRESESGEPCEIKISFPKDKSFDVVFGYELNMKIDEDSKDERQIDGESDRTSRETVDYLKETDRFVMVKKTESSVTVEVRFFFTGTYKLRLYGGYFKEFSTKPPWIMDLMMTCDNVIPQALPLPFDPGPIGWGPGPITENLGLYVPSHVESEVNVTDEEDSFIYFVLYDKLNVRVELHHCTIASNDLQEFVESGIVKIGDIITLQIRLMYPGKGEFGLKIDVASHQMDANACNYIIHTSEKRPFETFYPRRARRMLLNAMETCNIDFLKGSLDECERTGLPDNDPDVMGGRNRYEFLSCKTELYVALLVNRIDISEHALHRTRKANLDILLAREVTRVEEHLQKLLKLDEGGWTCDIPEIDRQSLVELSQLRKPKLEVRLVITTMYMLLGIDEEALKDWAKVRKFLRNQQSTLIEMARLEKYLMLGTTSDVTVDVSVLERVQEILMNYTQEDIRRVDNTAAAYFQWVTSVTEKLTENQRKLEEARAAKASAAKSTISKRLGVKNLSSKEDLRSSRLSLASRVTSLSSRTKTSFNKASVNSTTDIDETKVNKSQKSLRNKSLRSLSIASDLKTISEENQTLPKGKSLDPLSVKSEPRKSRTLTVNSKTETFKSFDRPSVTASSKEKDSNSRKATTEKSQLSMSKETVSRTSLKTQDSSRLKSRVSTGLEAVTNGSPFGNKSEKERSRISSGPDPVENGSGTFVRNSVNKSRLTLNTTPVSRRPSNVTRVSVKSVSKSSKINIASHSNVDEQQKEESNDAERINSFRNEEITGKTFFSESGQSQKGARSRPASIKSKLSSRGKTSK